MFSFWWDYWLKDKDSKGEPRGRAPSSTRVHPAVEELEDRTTPSTLIPGLNDRDLVFDSLRNVLYITTSSNTIQRFDIASQALLTPLTVGTSLAGADITADGSYLYAAESVPGTTQGVLHKINLSSGMDTDLAYNLGTMEGGGLDVVAGLDGNAFFTTSSQDSGSVPLHQDSLATDTLSTVTELGNIAGSTLVARDADRGVAFFDEPGSGYFLYSSSANDFSAFVNDTTSYSAVAVNRNGSLLALESPAGIKILNQQLNPVTTLSGMSGGMAFDPIHDLLYAANPSTGQIIAYDTQTWAQQFTLNIGESLAPSFNGAMTVSNDGQFLFYATPSGVLEFSLGSLTHTSTTVSASPASPGIVGQAVTFTATVTGGTVTGETVTFMDGDSTLGTAILNSSDQASLSTTTLAGGFTHSITAVYGGDSMYSGSSGSLTYLVNKIATTTTLSASPSSPSLVGQAVTFTATVTGGTVAGETIAFMDGSNTLGTATLNGSGQASLTTSTLAGGVTHSISAVYSGDANNLGSSGSLSFLVNKIATTTTLTASPVGSSVFEQPVTFTATVTGVVPANTVGEAVTFMDGSNVLGTAVLNSSGQATLTTPTVIRGVQTITASYTGDSEYASSSGSLSFTVNPPPGTPTNVIVNNPALDTTDQDTQSETAIVLGSGSNVIVAYNDSAMSEDGNNQFDGYSISTNGGATFTEEGALPASANGDGGDPVLARDNVTGQIYLATLDFDVTNDIQVFRSDNNGQSFEAPVNGAPGFGNVNLDKPWITVDNFAGPGQGNVYLVYRDFGENNGIYLSRSLDQGNTWGPSGGTLIAAGGTDDSQAPFVTVGPDHAVYVFWWDNTGTTEEIEMARSVNQGVSFGPSIVVATLKTTGELGDLGLTDANGNTFRTNAFPQAVINPTNPNLIYVVYDDTGVAPGDKADIFFTESNNAGSTWSTPLRVNDDNTTTDQWQPALAITPNGDDLGIFWYDRRFDPTNDNLFDRMGTIGTITGNTVSFEPDFLISTVPSPPVFGVDPAVAQGYMGDYDQAVASNQFFYTTWGDNRLPSLVDPSVNQPDVRLAEIPVPAPGTPVLDFANGFSGATDLTLNGSAKISGSNLELTNGGANEAGSVFATTPLSVTGFTTQFSFQLTNPQADGFAFVIQGNNANALGAVGGGLGYGGILNSVAIKFDLFSNNGEGPDSTGLYTNGAAPSIPSIDLSKTGINFHSGHVFNVGMTYNGSTLTVTIIDTVTNASVTESYNVNIPGTVGGNTAYMGFTGGSGGLTAVQNILSWTYTPTTLAAPTGLSATAGNGIVSLSWTASPGAASYNIYRGTSAGGESGTPIATGVTGVAFTDTGLTSGTTYFYKVTAVNAGGESSQSNEASATPLAVSETQVSLASAANRVGIVADGSKFTGGLDGGGNALSANLLGSSVLWNTTSFTLGTPNTADVVSAAGQTISLPAGSYTVLSLLATGVNGDQANQTFTVTYTDGTTQTFTQSFSDWHTPQSYSGEAIAATMAYRDTASGGKNNQTFNVYGYSFALNSAKTVQSLTLPNNSNVVILAATLLGNSITQPPAAPTALQATAGNAQVSLTWNPSAGAVTYNIYRGSASNGETLVKSGVAAASYTDTGVSNGTTYFYKVTAVNTAGESTKSNEASATPTLPAGLNFAGGFAGATGLTFNGSAKISGSNLELTDGGKSEAGSAFTTSAINVAAFTAQFSFQLTKASADGFAFVIQGNNANALGAVGGGMGYGGIPNSMAIKFDLYTTNGQGNDSTGLYTNGAGPETTTGINLSPTGINLHSGDVFNVAMSYNGTTLTVTIADTVTNASASESYTVNIPGLVGGQTAFVGFTGGSGGLTAIQNILNWTYTPQPPTPPPELNYGNGFSGATGLTLNGSTKLNGSKLELTDGGSNEAGSAFSSSPVNVAAFSTQFAFQLTNPNADGFAFVIQGDSANALGAIGGGMGYGGILNSMAIKFDLYSGNGQGNDSTGLYTNGAGPEGTTGINLSPTGINLHSGDVFNVGMTYNGTTLTVTITDTVTNATNTQSYAVNIPGLVGGQTAFVGFTGGTGGLTATQNILSWTFTST